MSDELRMPSVIDLEVLLRPISEENPAGQSMRYSGIYDEIAEARRADDTLNRGEWKTELKTADYARVIELALPALSEQTKDLQIGVWLAESITRKHGLAGFRDSLLLLTGFQDNFWETLYPEIDEGDMEGRANAIAWLDREVAKALKTAPITGGLGYSLNDWEDSKKFDFPENPETLTSEDKAIYADLRVVAERERRVTSTMWAIEKSQTSRAAIETVNITVEESWIALNDLNRVIEEKYDRNQMPGFSNLKKILDDLHAQVKKLLEEKRLEEPDEIEEFETIDEVENGDEPRGEAKGALSASGAIHNRKDALRRLNEIAVFFQNTEPHSPVSYLVQRAVKWGNMPLEVWLKEVIKDELVLGQLGETLGFDGGVDGLGS